MSRIETMMVCSHCQHQWVENLEFEINYTSCPSCQDSTAAPYITRPQSKAVPSELPHCAVCGYWHRHDDTCVEPEEKNCGKGEEWKE